MPKFRSDDRILSLAVPSIAEAAALSRILMNGSLVAIGSTEEVDEARREMAELENLMFLVADPYRVPWQQHFFTKILVPPHLTLLLPRLQEELTRLLAPGGEIISSSEDA